MNDTAWKLIEMLPERERTIVTLFAEGKTMEEIGKIFHITRSRVSAIVAKALRHCRYNAHRFGLSYAEIGEVLSVYERVGTHEI